MDTTNFLVAVVLMMLAASYGAYWLVIGIAVIMMLTMRSLTTFVLLIISLAVVFFFQGNIQEYAPYILFGLVILALALGNIGKPQEAAYPADMGLGGLGGMGLGQY
ncbi:hypothetical protein KKE06_05905 [Candidatus Micrarchaeota archaeon]|nr:hypothetical protein [Candidatus Micrarchaeota archaeon]MBU1930703.1 hypothetical protein [Candidatus Micrarchaeota archaeon]